MQTKITAGKISAIGPAADRSLSRITVRYVADGRSLETCVELPATNLTVGQIVIVKYDARSPQHCVDVEVVSASEAADPARLSIVRGGWEFLRDVVLGALTSLEGMYTVAVLLLVVALRYFFRGVAEVNQFFLSILAVAMAVTIFGRNAIERAQLRRSPSAAGLRRVKNDMGWVAACLVFAVIAFFAKLDSHGSSAPVAPIADQPDDVQRMLRDPRVLAGEKILHKLNEHGSTSQPATTQSAEPEEAK